LRAGRDEERLEAGLDFEEDLVTEGENLISENAPGTG
jgi:hypothetical protein